MSPRGKSKDTIRVDEVPDLRSDISVETSKPSYDDEIEVALVEMAGNFNVQMDEEKNERRSLILYLKIMLPIFAFAPLAVVIWLLQSGTITGSIETLGSLLTAILAVPIGIIGVFNVVSEKLFADTFRTSLPELLGKYKKFTGESSKL